MGVDNFNPLNFLQWKGRFKMTNEKKKALWGLVILVVSILVLHNVLTRSAEVINDGEENFVVWGKEYQDCTKLLITRNQSKQGGYDVTRNTVNSITEMITIHNIRSFHESLSNVMEGISKSSSCLYVNDGKGIGWSVRRVKDGAILTFINGNNEEEFTVSNEEAKDLLKKIQYLL